MNSVYVEMKKSYSKDDLFMKRIFELIESDLNYQEKTHIIWYLFEERRKKEKKDGPKLDEYRCTLLT